MSAAENTPRNSVRNAPRTAEKEGENERSKARNKPASEAKPKKVREPIKFPKLELSPRMKRIAGLVLMGISAFLLFSFISFLFSWPIDQSIVERLTPDQLSAAKPSDTANWMGILGAKVSSFFIYECFGLPAFLIIPFFFLLGYRILFEIKSIKLERAFHISLFFLVFLSVALAFFFEGSEYSYTGGKFGYESQLSIRGLIGSIGLVIVLSIVLLSFLVVLINLTFKIPALKLSKPSMENLYPVEKGTQEAQARQYMAASMDDDDDDQDNSLDDIKLIIKNPGGIEVSAPDTAEAHFHDEDEDEPPFISDEKPVAPAKAPVKNGIDFSIKPKMMPKPMVYLPESSAPIGTDEDSPNRESWYKYPPLGILKEHESNNTPVDPQELQDRKDLIVNTLDNYKIKIDKIEATIGPTVTLYEIIPAPGIRISKIKSLEDDIALSLAALGIRIIAPMPGKGTIGIEVPNTQPEIVSLKEALASEEFRNSTADLPIAMGKTISNEVYVADLAKMPHLLMAGATGQGKSVGINTIIASILYKKHPEDVKFILVDPKKVELSLFKLIEKHFLPELPDGQEAIITDTKMVVDVLKSLCVEMDERYDKLKDAQVRNIKEYNKKIERGLVDRNEHKKLPFIILVIDELADLMMTAGKEVELPIARLAQLARAIGIHLIVATQRPSVNIITGVIKANFPARLAFRVTSRIDSRTILDAGGAEQLIGRGDMLLSTGNDLIRLQCPYIDTEEVEELTKFISEQPYPERFRLNIYSEDGTAEFDDSDGDLDSMFEDAARLIIRTQQGSTSMLQRKLKLGYNRAGRVMDQLERAGIVGGNEGSKAREVLIQDEYQLEQFLNDRQNKYK